MRFLEYLTTDFADMEWHLVLITGMVAGVVIGLVIGLTI